ncbi:HEAT repeat domain-containing protein [Streptomyces sp. NPDC049577]|uniref:HEAT repeat domain-containing protein n=1 Tax=Streptomyces sp. NPDC049577 TaxID=3155153 RepID=UPI00342B34A8
MAYTLPAARQSPITLADYLDHINATVDTADTDSVLASADALSALNGDADLLVDHLNQELADLASWQNGNPYMGPSLLLGHGENFSVRANIWLPPARMSLHEEQTLHSYEVPHDHTFSFLTVGHFGPGYETTIWEYDPHTVTGVPGEHVELRLLEHTDLPRGKVMYYRAGRDIHTQHHPPALSVSLNLLIHRQDDPHAQQRFFDTDGGRLTGNTPSPATRSHQILCDLAGHLGDQRTAPLLEHLATTHPSPAVRASALENSVRVLGPDAEPVLLQAADDPHPAVHGPARNALDSGTGNDRQVKATR